MAFGFTSFKEERDRDERKWRTGTTGFIGARESDEGITEKEKNSNAEEITREFRDYYGTIFGSPKDDSTTNPTK